MKTRKIACNMLIYIALSIMLIVTLYPIMYTILASFKSNVEILTNPASMFPKNPTLDNYKIALTSESFNVPILLKNSLIYTLACVFANVVISAMAGYTFARGHFRFKKLIFASFSALLFIKLGGISVYPTFEVLSLINLDRSLLALIIVHCFSIPVVNIYLVFQ